MRRLSVIVLLLLFYAIPATAIKKAVTGNTHNSAPSFFIENKGQITDQNNNPRNDIAYKIQAGNISVFIGSGQVHYQWTGKEISGTTPTYRMDVVLVGANTNANWVAEDKQPYNETYLLPIAENGLTAGSYIKLTCKNIYPNIDWVLYTNKGGIKYDFIVHPGGKVSNIKLQYLGATNLSLLNGGVLATTPMGTVAENKPYSYTKEVNKSINTAFHLEDNILSFDVDEYSGTLVIDPAIDWASYYGDVGADDANGVASDLRGNVYVAGVTTSVSNIATAGVHQIALAGQSDAFIAAFDIDGNRKWATYFGGNDFDYCYDIACDSSANLYVCGKTSSLGGISTLGAFQTAFGGGTDDGFIARFTKDGQRVWGSYFGGPGSDAVNNINCDILGNLFLGGSTTSAANIAYINAYQLAIGGLTDGFIARFNPLGQRQWSTYFGGPNVDAINFTSPDVFGNVYAYGTTQSTTVISVGGVHQTNINTASPTSFLTKFNLVGNAVWSTYFGGTAGATPSGLVTDAAGNPYICGFTTSTTGISTPGAPQFIKNTGEDGYLSKFNPTGAQLWGTYYGNTGQDNFTGITFNFAKNQVYTSGITTSTTGITTAGAIKTTIGGTQDAFYTQWDPANGFPTYSSYFGGNNIENISATGIGSFIDYNFGKIYLCGSTTSTSGLATINGYKQVYGGGISDAYVGSVLFDTIVYILPGFADTLLCEGSSFNVPYKVSFPFDPGNIFTVQLSDDKGSFSTSTNIGVVAATTSGTIACQIPMGTVPDTSYLLRIVASIAPYTSIDNGRTIQIDNIPQQPIISNGSPVCIDDTLKLTIQNLATGVNYFWNGAGFTGFASAVIFNKAAPSIEGAYTVTPSIGACTGLDATTVVTVKPTPHIISSGSNTPVCEGTSINLVAQADSLSSTYKWEGPAGFIATTQNANVPNTSVVNSGLYTVAATYNGCVSKKDSLLITIKRNPVPSANSNSPVCETDTLKLSTVDADVQTTFSWSGPQGFTSVMPANAIPNVSFAASGKYYVTATNNGCTGNDTIDVLVKPMPFPAASNNSPVCSGERLVLSVTSKSPTTRYNWYGPDDFNKTEQNPEIQHAGVGAQGFYRIIANLDGCVQEDTTTVTINQTPVTVLSSNSPVYKSAELDIYASNNLGTATYSWTGPNSFKSNNQNLQFTTSVLEHTGMYYLQTDYMGCTAIDSIFIVVYNISEGNFILFPSPNDGDFSIRGVMATEEELPMAIYDATGRIVHADKVRSKNKLIDRKISLGGRLASGIYVFKLQTANGSSIERKFTIVR